MEYDRKCKNCELPAWIYCLSENVNLCWDCDTIAHQDNPSVSVHLRQVLCHKCQSKTIWYGSGPKLPISMACCYLCDPKTSGNYDFITQRVIDMIYLSNKDQDYNPLLDLDLSKISPADAKAISDIIKSLDRDQDNNHHHMPSTTIIIEHGNDDPIFKITAEEITTGLYLLVDHNFTVEINPMSEPRKGSFVISTNEGPPYICLLDLEQPYDELKNLDKKALINKLGDPRELTL